MKLPIRAWLILVFLSTNCLAYGDDPYAGKYELVTPPQKTVNPNKVEVVGVFWYTCPHCYYFEKNYLKNWQKTKADYVELIHMPAVFSNNDRRLSLAKAYYTAQVLDVLDKIHPALFKAIHDDKRQMNNENALQSLFAEHGVSKMNFTRAYNSFFVDLKIRHAKEMTKGYALRAVPAVIVNGKYRLSSTIAEGYVNMMKILNYLIEKEHKLIQSRLSGN